MLSERKVVTQRAAVLAIAVMIPTISAIGWASGSGESLQKAETDMLRMPLDTFACSETFGCVTGPVMCAEFSHGGFTVKCTGTISET